MTDGGAEPGQHSADGDTPERRLISGAIGFAMAAHLLYEHTPDLPPWPTCFVNLGFGMELALKAYLRARGTSEGEQKALGHDLSALLRRSVELGLQPSHEAIPHYVDALSPHHKDMSLRYLEGDSVDLPGIMPTYAAVRQLIDDVVAQASLRASIRKP